MNPSLGVVFRKMLSYTSQIIQIIKGRVTGFLNMDCHRQRRIKPCAQVPCRRHRSDSCSPDTKLRLFIDSLASCCDDHEFSFITVQFQFVVQHPVTNVNTPFDPSQGGLLISIFIRTVE